MSEVGYGTEPRPDDPWAAVAAELAPDRSLARVAVSARHTATSVTIVGVVLTGAGLVASNDLALRPLSGWLAACAIAVAFVAVLFALSYVSISVDRVNPRNLAAVEAYAVRQFGWARLAVWAGRLLVLAVLLAGAAAVAALIGVGGTPVHLALESSGEGASRSISGEAELASLGQDQTVTAQIVAHEPSGSRVAYAARSTPDARGAVLLAPTGITVRAGTTCELVVLVDDVPAGSLTLPPPPAR